MSEETTERLGGENSFEARVLAALGALNNRLTSEMAGLNNRLTSELAAVNAELAAVNNRLTSMNNHLISLEEKVDARLRETRPIWEAVLSRVEVVDSKLNVFAHDMMDVRAEIELLKRRNPPAA